MLTNFKLTFLHKGLVILALGGVFALSGGACSSSNNTPVTTGNAGHGGNDGGAGTTGSAGSDGGAGTTGSAGTDGGAGTTGAAGTDGGAGTGAAGTDGGAGTGGDPQAVHLSLINADTTGGVTITRAAPKDYNTCK